MHQAAPAQPPSAGLVELGKTMRQIDLGDPPHGRRQHSERKPQRLAEQMTQGQGRICHDSEISHT
jgi:hypothetical protein